MVLKNTERYIRVMVKAGVEHGGNRYSVSLIQQRKAQLSKRRAHRIIYRRKIHDIFDMVRRLRTGDDAVTVPLVFMTYLNPIYVFGREKFFTLCEEVGISGVIVPDMPFEEKAELGSDGS